MIVDGTKKERIENGSAELAKITDKYIYVRRQAIASTNLIMASLCYGVSFAFTGTLLPLIRDYVDEENETWLAAINVGVIILGSYFGMHVASCFGNKKILFLSDIMSIIGWICLSLASEFVSFSIGCTLVGFSSGMKNQISLTYRVEIPEKELRGIISTVLTSSYMLGIFLGHLSAIIFPWRAAMRVCSFSPIISMFTIPLIPESPMWLLSQGRKEEARENFYWLHGQTPNSEMEFSSMMKKQTKSECCSEIQNTISKMCSRRFFVPFVISSILLTAQCGSGYDVVVVYTEDILSNMSSQINAGNVTILFDTISLVFCTLSCIFVKLMPRRTLFFLSSAGTMVTLALLILIILNRWSTDVLTVCLCVYTAFVNVGILPVSWLVLTEIFPETERDLGVCVSTGYFSFVTFLLVKLVPILEFRIGIVAALGLFLGIVITCSFLLFFIMPETKELALEDIEDMICQGKFYQYLEIFNCNNQHYIVND